MTRGIIGIVLLLVLLAGGMFTQWTMDKIQSPITQELTQAAQAGERRLWNAATLHQQTAARAWRKSWRVTAAFADHMPMEDIDSLFACWSRRMPWRRCCRPSCWQSCSRWRATSRCCAR